MLPWVSQVAELTRFTKSRHIFFVFVQNEITMTSENIPGRDSEQQPQKNNSPDKAIDTPKEVEESRDANIDEDFPGYPHYPAKEDIITPENGERVDVDVEKLTRSHTITPDHLKNISE
jgi:hypothetical protein